MSLLGKIRDLRDLRMAQKQKTRRTLKSEGCLRTMMMLKVTIAMITIMMMVKCQMSLLRYRQFLLSQNLSNLSLNNNLLLLLGKNLSSQCRVTFQRGGPSRSTQQQEPTFTSTG